MSVYAQILEAVVKAGETQSSGIPVSGYIRLGLVIPSDFDGDELSFDVSVDGALYQQLYDITGSPVDLPVSASRSYDLPGELGSWPFFRIVCDSIQAVTDTTFIVSMR